MAAAFSTSLRLARISTLPGSVPMRRLTALIGPKASVAATSAAGNLAPREPVETPRITAARCVRPVGDQRHIPGCNEAVAGSTGSARSREVFKWWSPTARAARQVAKLPRFFLHGQGLGAYQVPDRQADNTNKG